MTKIDFKISLIFCALFFAQVSMANAAKIVGEACQKPADCASGFCGENGYGGGAAYTCQGTLPEGATCSITDQKMQCQSGLLCQGDTLKCEVDSRGTVKTPITDSIMQQQQATDQANALNGQGYKGPTCPTCFTNPLSFVSVEDFLTHFLVVLQRIIVLLSLVAIVYGAVMYIIGGTMGSVDSAKKIIASAITGLAIGIAAPSILKELAGILGWGATKNDTVDAALTLSEIAVRVLNFMLGTMGILALVMMVIGAIMYISSGGDQDQVNKGKNIFKYSLIGVVLAMSSMVLVTQIAAFFAR